MGIGRAEGCHHQRWRGKFGGLTGFQGNLGQADLALDPVGRFLKYLGLEQLP